MPNCCVAAGFGNMPSESVSLFVFRKIHICAVFGPDKFNERGELEASTASVLCSEHFSVDCFDDIPALKANATLA